MTFYVCLNSLDSCVWRGLLMSLHIFLADRYRTWSWTKGFLEIFWIGRILNSSVFLGAWTSIKYCRSGTSRFWLVIYSFIMKESCVTLNWLSDGIFCIKLFGLFLFSHNVYNYTKGYMIHKSFMHQWVFLHKAICISFVFPWSYLLHSVWRDIFHVVLV